MTDPQPPVNRPPDRGDHPVIYKILRLTEWEKLSRTGQFDGSADDKRDGFIHLSGPKDVQSTLDKYYTVAATGGEDIVLVAVDALAVTDRLIYEAARGTMFFPHIYGRLEMTAVAGHTVLSAKDGGYHAELDL